jgi:hypothetical protein
MLEQGPTFCPKKVHLIVREELFLAWLWAKILIK